MKPPVTIYHNPRCSKSRQALDLIRAAGFEPEIVEYLRTPLSAHEVAELLKKLGLPSARAMMRTGEEVYKEKNLAAVNDDRKLVTAMAAHPVLIERPIVLTAKGAAICRPPEKVMALLR